MHKQIVLEGYLSIDLNDRLHQSVKHCFHMRRKFIYKHRISLSCTYKTTEKGRLKSVLYLFQSNELVSKKGQTVTSIMSWEFDLLYFLLDCCWLVGWLARKRRKDLPVLFYIYTRFKKKKPNIRLCLLPFLAQLRFFKGRPYDL